MGGLAWPPPSEKHLPPPYIKLKLKNKNKYH
nr:MAG TPA: hypothetical protein [Caudoviricetes sp.]DAY07517.1 MAG TPA: hypothetical protein [Caudoviricetes sp.]